MSSIKIWGRVPDGSTLEVLVEPTKGRSIAAARLRRENGSETEWVNSDLVPGPKKTRIKAPENYVVTLRVLFTGAAAGGNAASIRATVTKPNGDVHGTPYTHAVAGANGESARATILVQPEKS